MRAVILLIVWFLAVPLGLGSPAACYMEKDTFVTKFLQSIVTGYFVMLGVFQLVASVCVVFGFSTNAMTLSVAIMLGVLSILGYVFSGILNSRVGRYPYEDFGDGLSAFSVIFYVLTLLMLGMRIYIAIAYQTPNGDDSYYIAQAVAAVEKNVLCRIAPYSGYITDINARHDLATFPLFYGFLSKLSGLHPAVIAHTVWPPVLLTVVTFLWILIGQRLTGKEHASFFAFLVSLLTMMGGVSHYTSEMYLLTRTWQGKAMLCGFVVPAVLWLFLSLADLCDNHNSYIGTIRYNSRGQSDYVKRIVMYALVLSLITLTGLFASAISLLLISVSVGVFTVIFAIRFKQIRIPLLVAAFPAIIQIAYVILMLKVH